MNPEILRYAAFTTDPAAGNPAGVVLDAEGMDDNRMLECARDIGYSETAFVTSEHGRNRIRYFSPKAEVDFCGHATVATAAAMAERHGDGSLLFETNVGAVPVQTTIVDGQVTATLTSVPTRTREATESEIVAALAALGWSRTDLDTRFPPHVSFAGAEHLVLSASSRDRLSRLDYDFDQLLAVMNDAGWTTVQLFWAESDHVFHARNPFPVGGVVEDPATGAAAAALGGYLKAIRKVTKGRITIRQGEDMGMPSRLLVDIDDSLPGVRVTGSAVEISGR